MEQMHGMEENPMFLDELSPFVQELIGHPAAFLGGVASGLLRLNLADDPVQDWLRRQGANPTPDSNHQNGSGPQTITID
ncbi:hypothetical protein [Phormidium sp. FACHB-1136]|jgi:hypothetical protein|uniref:hypothetical protein n=1 Tax=Phormidium sp. FACHB-1136 TaxID=2692848 RepID=UPI00321F977C